MMPSIYRGECEECGFATPDLYEGFFALLLDDPDDSTPPLEQKIAALPLRDGSEVLKKHGYTFFTASHQGKLVLIGQYLCRGCGKHYEARNLTAFLGGQGCALAFFSSLLSGGMIGFLSQTQMSLQWLIFGLPLLIPIGHILNRALLRYARLTYPERAIKFGKPQCPKCDSLKATNGRNPLIRCVPCPRCRSKSLRIIQEAVFLD